MFNPVKYVIKFLVIIILTTPVYAQDFVGDYNNIANLNHVPLLV